MGNSFLPDCYKVFDASEKFSTYQVAEKECQTVGGELASVSADLDLRIATVVNDFFNNNESTYYIYKLQRILKNWYF